MAKGQKGIQKGEVANPGGRGNVPNKVTTETRNLILIAVERQSVYFDETMERIRRDSPCDWAKIMVKMCDFILPKQMNLNVNGNIINVIPPDKRIEISAENQKK